MYTCRVNLIFFCIQIKFCYCYVIDRNLKSLIRVCPRRKGRFKFQISHLRFCSRVELSQKEELVAKKKKKEREGKRRKDSAVARRFFFMIEKLARIVLLPLFHSDAARTSANFFNEFKCSRYFFFFFFLYNIMYFLFYIPSAKYSTFFIAKYYSIFFKTNVINRKCKFMQVRAILARSR
ncbi:hypothetical protein PUN28_012166 [Cardiocondyla obscurior]|uniref:Uncharacterized protein n=1 Tax=Cardiocondyla obscurior TaxID=286306 RepID=A0AAW2FDS5_9HYME